MSIRFGFFLKKCLYKQLHQIHNLGYFLHNLFYYKIFKNCRETQKIKITESAVLLNSLLIFSYNQMYRIINKKKKKNVYGKMGKVKSGDCSRKRYLSRRKVQTRFRETGIRKTGNIAFTRYVYDYPIVDCPLCQRSDPCNM